MKAIEIFFRKLLLRLLIFFKQREPLKEIPRFNSSSKLLFIRLNRIGDALVTTPLLSKVKKEIGCKISVLASEQNHFIFENNHICDEVIIFHKKQQSLASLISELNRRNFDAVIDLHDDVSTTVSYIIAFSNSHYKFGMLKKTAQLYTNTVQREDPSAVHVVDRIMQFGSLFNLRTGTEKIIFNEGSEAAQSAGNFAEHNFHKGRFTVAVNISAGSEARFWGEENYIKLFSLLSGYNLNLVILCAEKDLPKAQKIVNDQYPIYHHKSFNHFCAILNRVDLLFTPDTSIVHVASAMNKPVFGIYVNYNTEESIWSPYKTPFACVITKDSTLKNITFENVKQKFIPFLEEFLYGSANTKL